MPALRLVLLVLRAVGWTLLVGAALGWILFGYWRLRLGGHRVPGVSLVEQRLLWDKDDLYTPEGRRVLALCGFAFEVALTSSLVGAGLVALVQSARE